MIVGDKIVTANLLIDRQLIAVSVVAIEKHDYVWMFFKHTSVGSLYVAHAHVDAWVDDPRETLFRCVGRVSKRDRGITWAPAWIESEVDQLRVSTALMTL